MVDVSLKKSSEKIADGHLMLVELPKLARLVI
jgi:hypothetical protein